MDGRHFLDDVIRQFYKQKDLADRAMAQINDGAFFAIISEPSNSIAIIVKHLAGNMRSRWTDFLTSDGEKPDRDRESEFVIDDGDSRATLTERWEQGWRCLFDALAGLTPDDLGREVTIRGEPHTVIEAMLRQFSHYAYHVGQVVFLARHLAGKDWQTLTDVHKAYKQF